MSNKFDFCHLHRHCEASIQDGVGKVEDGVKYAAEMGHKAVGITDHGNIISYVRFYNQAKESGIKHIFGLEAYLVDDMNLRDKEHRDYNHCTIFVKNEQGLKNIIKLNNISHRDGFYYRPRLDWDTLFKHKDGLIILSGCVIGRTCQYILGGKYSEALAWNRLMKKEIGEDYYIELMLSDFSEQKTCNKELLNISKSLDIPGVITADAHYVRKDDYQAQKVMMLLQSKATIKQYEEQKRRKAEAAAAGVGGQEEKDKIWIFESDQYWMKNENEIEEAWNKWHGDYYPKAEFEQHMNESGKIADKVEVVHLDTSYKMPKAVVPDGVVHYDYFMGLLREAMNRMKLTGILEYEQRLATEVEIIEKKGIVDYFLVNYDVISWAKRNDIFVGPGRGSVAGSLVSYLLNMTEVDPLKYGLLFERFIDLGRQEMPDVDTDFEIDRRNDVKQFIIERYGERHVASICTLGTFHARNIVRDIMRVYDFDPQFVNYISKKIPEDARFIDGELLDGDSPIQDEELNQLFDQNPHIRLTASTLFGQIRHVSKHAAGVIITDKPLDECIATIRVRDEIMTAWTEGIYRKELTQLNVLKLDILGLKTLSVIKKACQLIGMDYRELVRLDVNDYQVYDAVVSADLIKGIFQFDSNTGGWLFQHMKPKTFNDIVALAALDRPGPLDSGMAFEYIDRMHGQVPLEKYVHPAIQKTLGETYGVIVYQEQLMMLAKELSGFTAQEASRLRKNLVKIQFSKEAIEKVQKDRKILKKMFIEGAIKNECDEKTVTQLWEAMTKFARYGFNKAHTVSYSLVSFWTMWLKVYHPTEFYAALLSYANEDELIEILVEMRRLGIELESPDVNLSGIDFTPDKSRFKVLFGLNKIKFLGTKAQQQILELRPFKSFEDFAERTEKMVVNKKAKDALIRSGAFKSLEDDSAILLQKHATMCKRKSDPEIPLPYYTKQDQLNDESKFLGTIISDEIRYRKRRANVESQYRKYVLNRLRSTTPELLDTLKKYSGEWTDENTGRVYERFTGFILGVDSMTSKSGHEMAKLIVETFHDGKAMPFFILKWHELYEQVKKLQPNQAVAIAIDKRERKGDYSNLTHIKVLT